MNHNEDMVVITEAISRRQKADWKLQYELTSYCCCDSYFCVNSCHVYNNSTK